MSKVSLKKKLHSALRSAGSISLDQAHAIASTWGYKQSTAERELRQSNSPKVKTIYNHKGHTTGYQWVERKQQQTLI